MGIEDHKCGNNCINPAVVFWHTGLPLCQEHFDEWVKRDYDIIHDIDLDTKEWL